MKCDICKCTTTRFELGWVQTTAIDDTVLTDCPLCRNLKGEEWTKEKRVARELGPEGPW